MKWVQGESPIVVKKHPNGLNNLTLETYELVEFESLEDIKQFLGSEQDVVDYVTRSVQRDQKAIAYPILRAATKESDQDEVFQNARNAIRQYRPQIGASVTQKEKISRFDDVMANISSADENRTYTKEELLAILQGSK